MLRKRLRERSGTGHEKTGGWFGFFHVRRLTVNFLDHQQAGFNTMSLIDLEARMCPARRWVFQAARLDHF
jgi:hypothetical protein